MFRLVFEIYSKLGIEHDLRSLRLHVVPGCRFVQHELLNLDVIREMCMSSPTIKPRTRKLRPHAQSQHKMAVWAWRRAPDVAHLCAPRVVGSSRGRVRVGMRKKIMKIFSSSITCYFSNTWVAKGRSASLHFSQKRPFLIDVFNPASSQNLC